MTVTVGTHKLIDHLTDALHTGGGVVDGIHLATTRGAWKDEPGKRDLLVATSTNRYVLGHTWIPCDGTITSMVWPYGSTRTLLGVLKVLSKKGENHCVDIDMVRAEPKPNAKNDEHPGWIVTVSETKALFDSDTKYEFHAHPEARFPIDWAMRILAGDFETPDDYEETRLTLWGSDTMKRLAAIAARRGMDIQLFRSPERNMQMVQIGPTWLGAATPLKITPDHSTAGPSEEAVLSYTASSGAFILRDGDGLFARERKRKKGKGEPQNGGAGASTEEPQLPEDDADGSAVTDEPDTASRQPVNGDTMASDYAEQQAPATASTVSEEDMLRQAIELVLSTRIGSPTMLQRKLKITYARANALLDTMTGHGIVGPAVGSAARDVLSHSVGDALRAAGLA